MKRLLNIALMAATVCCLSLAVTSCKDDDNSENNNGNGSSEQAEQEPAAADRFWAVAANLVSPFDVTDDYADKTFEPTIGEPTDGNTTVRTVNATDINVAAASFASITGTDISAETSTYTFHDDAVGTLTYNKSTDGQSLATVDVSIKQIPGLQRIVFKSQEQMGSNAVTSGVPYYSFGDIISRLRKDGKTEYWICIHPAFTKQGISTSQWATLSPLPEENVWKYTGSNKIDYALPTKLGEHKKEMQQMAELTYALLDPETWYDNAKNNGIKAFNDILPANLQYINDIFWQRVQNQWIRLEVWDKVFSYTYQQMKDLGYADATQKTPLHFLGKGYSWHTTWSNYPTLFQYSYSNGTAQTSNMHNYQNKKVSKNVIANNIELNCQTQISAAELHWINGAFFDDETPRYIFRTATDKELFGKNPDPFATMANNNGIKDVYVYNNVYKIEVGINVEMVAPEAGEEVSPAITADEAKVGNFITSDGRFWTTKEEADNHGGAVAVVAYVGGNKRVETDSLYNGLAIALNRVTFKKWAEVNEYCSGIDNFEILDDAINDFKGMYNTHILSEVCPANHNHDAARACSNYVEVNSRGNTISRWFLPSIGQWHLAIKEMKKNSSEENFLTKYALDKVLRNKIAFWSSTPKDIPNAYYFQIDNSSSYLSHKNAPLSCLPFLAFKYGEGGSVNPSN